MNKKKLIIASGIANTFEWYDYALFGSFASLIGTKFFPGTDATASMLNAFLVFAIGYLMRPLGGIVFGVIGDKFGRRFALSSSVICMSLPTAAIGILPTYDMIGSYASYLMVFMRMLQGLSMGGALTGSISFLIEHSDKKNRGVIASIPMAGICVGILLGTVVSYVVRENLSAEFFDLWGWRIPFILGVFIMFVGFYIRKYTDETPVFKQLEKNGEIIESPLKYVFKHHWSDMLISIMINSTGSVLFYFQAIYVSNFLKNTRWFSASSVDKLSAMCYIIMAFVCILSGKISDLIGRKKLYIFILLLSIMSISSITDIIQLGSFEVVVLFQIFLAIVAALYIGPEPALQAELYPTAVRSTALSVSYNLATSIFGGTTPYIIAYLYNKTNSLIGCSYYVIATSFMSLIGLYFYKAKYTAKTLAESV